MTGVPKSARQLFLGYLLDIVLPIATYSICSALGLPPQWGMVWGAAMALASTARNTLKNRKIDRIGMLVIAEIAGSIVLLNVGGSPRILLAKPALYTLIVGIYLIATSFRGKPINYEGVKGMASKGEPARAAAFDRIWETTPTFRRAIRMAAVGWGIAFIVDSILRVVVIYSSPLKEAMMLGYVPHGVAMVILLGFSAVMGKALEKIANPRMAELGAADG
ncbi:MAG TPA: VC0807 family protein [Fimbriimonas sp.]|nr:VC0807 family protein [Fimbriimonas sp.]